MTARLLARGVGASPGRATGVVVLRAEEAVARAAQGERVVLVRIDTNPEDVPGMQVAAGIVTTRGGVTGDAAIVARTLGKPCIASCSALHVDYAAGTVTVWGEPGDVVVATGDLITIDGGRGEIWLGEPA